jgi:hypothetical protein
MDHTRAWIALRASLARLTAARPHIARWSRAGSERPALRDLDAINLEKEA